MGGFLFFFYMFFALATSVYHDYKLTSEIENFKDEINDLAETANQKPDDLKYLKSKEYKDRYAKENLNLLNPGEKLIILPEPKQNVEQGPVQLMTDFLSPDSVLNQPTPHQWWAYFFGSTLTFKNLDPILPLSEQKKNEPAGQPAEG